MNVSARYIRLLYLQSVLEELVHLGHLGGDGQVDGAVADFNNKSTTDLGVDLGNDLELLALSDVLRLADGGLEASDGLVVEGLLVVSVSVLFMFCTIQMSTYSSAGDNELDLATVRTHQDAEVVHNTL